MCWWVRGSSASWCWPRPSEGKLSSVNSAGNFCVFFPGHMLTVVLQLWVIPTRFLVPLPLVTPGLFSKWLVTCCHVIGFFVFCICKRVCPCSRLLSSHQFVVRWKECWGCVLFTVWARCRKVKLYWHLLARSGAAGCKSAIRCARVFFGFGFRHIVFKTGFDYCGKVSLEVWLKKS